MLLLKLKMFYLVLSLAEFKTILKIIHLCLHIKINISGYNIKEKKSHKVTFSQLGRRTHSTLNLKKSLPNYRPDEPKLR